MCASYPEAPDKGNVIDYVTFDVLEIARGKAIETQKGVVLWNDGQR